MPGPKRLLPEPTYCPVPAQLTGPMIQFSGLLLGSQLLYQLKSLALNLCTVELEGRIKHPRVEDGSAYQ